MNAEQQYLVDALTAWVVDGSRFGILKSVAKEAGLSDHETNSLLTMLETIGEHVA